MRFVALLLTLLAAVHCAFAALHARQSLPSCATACLANANTGSCSATDDACLCQDQAFINSTITCVTASCSGSDVQNAEAFAQSLCAAVGVTLTLPSALATATATATATAATTSTTPQSSASVTASISAYAGAVLALVVAAIL